MRTMRTLVSLVERRARRGLPDLAVQTHETAAVEVVHDLGAWRRRIDFAAGNDLSASRLHAAPMTNRNDGH